MTTDTTGPYIFISGASRGIGLNLVFVLTERIPSATIFAGARDPASSTELNGFAKKHPNVKVVKLIADDAESNKQAVEEIKKITGRLDIVVANAGIASQPGPIQNADPKVFTEMFEVNTLGPLYMYQATYPLLIESRANNKDSNAPAPKFFITSSLLGSLGGFYDGFIVAPYGVSKAAVNYLALSIHHQTKDVGAVVIPYHPGLVMTDMNTKNNPNLHLLPPGISPEQSAQEYADLIQKATREEHGGKLWGQGSTSEPLPW